MQRATNQVEIVQEQASPVEPSTNASPGLKAERASSIRRKHWGGRTFRFSFRSFRLGRGLSVRRFSMTEATLLLIAAYIASKGLGAIRQLMFNALFGTGPTATAYIAAFKLPDTLFNLIAGGALSSALIPVFISYEQQKGTKETWRLISLVFNLLLVTLTACALLAECLAPQFVSNFLIPGLPASEKALTTTLTRIMLLHPLILGIGTVVTAILKSKRQFLLPALSIAIYDIGLIGGLLVSLAMPRVGIYGPTFGLLLSAVCQVGIQIPGLLKQGVHYTFTWNLRHPGLYEISGMLAPNLLALGIVSVSSILDTAFASYLPDQASIAAMQNAALLAGLPAVLLAAIGQSLLPLLTLQWAQKHYVHMSQAILKIVGGSVLLSIPAALCLCILGRPAIHIFFRHGAFTAHSAALTYMALIGSAVALPGLVADGLLIVCFYAMKDAKTPLFTNIALVAVHVGALILLLKSITGQYAILAIPLTGAITGTAEAMLLCFILFLRLRARVKTDKGFKRLQMQRLRMKSAQAE